MVVGTKCVSNKIMRGGENVQILWYDIWQAELLANKSSYPWISWLWIII